MPAGQSWAEAGSGVTAPELELAHELWDWGRATV